MTANDYQKKAHGFVSGGASNCAYPFLGLAEEAGEVLGKVAKYIRKHYVWPSDAQGALHWRDGGYRDFKEDVKVLSDISKELGDCMWMIAEICTKMGFSLERVMERNIRKLEGRRERGTIVGEGDER